MIRIAICDDSAADLKALREKTIKYMKGRVGTERVSVVCYAVSRQLWYDVQGEEIADIYILDVDMPGVDGFALAEIIHSHNPAAIILFLTAHMELAAKGYLVQAFRYIHKLNVDAELTEALDAALKQWAHAKKASVALRHYGEYCRVLHSEIKYVKRVGRQLEIGTTSFDTVRDNRGVKAFFTLLNDSRFVFIDRSCFVNIDYIQQIIGWEVVLTTGERLAVSRRMLQNLKAVIAEEWKL